MANIIHYVSSKEAERGFYPTPTSLANKMMSKVDWKHVTSILEPNAGKGDLALAAISAWRRSRGINSQYEISSNPVDLDCVEIDPNLRAILKENGLRVVHDDFLSYSTMKRYSLIVMNPCFSDGAQHILKALSLLKPEGQLVALCNAETIRNHASNIRNKLVQILDTAEIEYVQDAFASSERKTHVEIALITYKAPAETVEDSLIIDRLRPAHKYIDMPAEESAALTKSDFVDAIIDRYNYEVECGVHLIQEYKAVSKVLNTSNDMQGMETLCLSLGKNDTVNENEWVRSVRYKYWSMLFASPQFVSQLTTNLRQSLYERVHEMADYEFSHYNIKEIMIQMNAHVSDGIESTIMSLFDDWTRKYHWDVNAQNRHYFDGWKTNDAFAVNKRVVLPLRGYTDWGSRYTPEFRMYNVREKLADIEKVFNYLDGGRTPEISLVDVLSAAEKTGDAKKIESKYFWLTFYKKGTCHIEFKDIELLAKFNIFAARGKNWLPPSFGKKHYRDLEREEKQVVDSFMGSHAENKYENIVANSEYYLQNGYEKLNLTA